MAANGHDFLGSNVSEFQQTQAGLCEDFAQRDMCLAQRGQACNISAAQFQYRAAKLVGNRMAVDSNKRWSR